MGLVPYLKTPSILGLSHHTLKTLRAGAPRIDPHNLQTTSRLSNKQNRVHLPLQHFFWDWLTTLTPYAAWPPESSSMLAHWTTFGWKVGGLKQALRKRPPAHSAWGRGWTWSHFQRIGQELSGFVWGGVRIGHKSAHSLKRAFKKGPLIGEQLILHKGLESGKHFAMFWGGFSGWSPSWREFGFEKPLLITDAWGWCWNHSQRVGQTLWGV